MPTEALQRTLLIGLGHTGAQTAEQLLAALPAHWGQTGMVQAVAMLADDIPLAHIDASFSPPATPWPVEAVRRLEQVLRDISQLDHQARLRQQGVSLRHADEIHALIIANPAEEGVTGILPGLIRTLRQTARRVLACHTSLTGVWLSIPPAIEGADEAAVTGLSDEGTGGWPLPDHLPLSEFDRGCFVAGLTNEVGLIVGDADTLIQRTVTFLALLIREITSTGLAGLDEGPAGWGVPLTSFGLATIHWPGCEVAQVLSDRWSHTLLNQLVTPSPPKNTWGDQAQTAARQWLQSHRLVPSLLLEHLTAPMPPLPDRLVALVPEAPWPWLLADVNVRLEQAGQQWQDAWLAERGLRQDMLTKLIAAWPDQAETWLKQQLESFDNGEVVAAQCYLAAVSELLQTFVTDLENQLAEAQQDLANMAERARAVAGPLAGILKTMPDSTFGTLLLWGTSPFKWPAYLARCREAQTMARQLAHLIRGRLVVWQTVSFYEEILPFYHHLRQLWHDEVKIWIGHCEQVRQASQSPHLAEWPARLEKILTRSTGPWSETLVSALYDEAVEQNAGFVSDQAGSFTGWQAEQLSAADIVQHLQAVTHQALEEAVLIPSDHLLCRRFPTPPARLEWLAGLLEQARPFWRFDETMLAEAARAQVHQETWLLLPDAETSPLAELGQIGAHPVRLVSTHTPAEMGIVALRRWVHVLEPDNEETEPPIYDRANERPGEGPNY